MSQKNINHTRALYVDLESTCWSGLPPEDMQTEIIQLGISEIDTVDLKVRRNARFYIKPKRKWEISPYCTNLTGITHDHIIKMGRPINEIFATITKEWGPRNKITYAWGNDNDDIKQACFEHNIRNPFGHIFDLGVTFRTSFGMKQAVNLEYALNYLGLKFEGVPHDALNDARATGHLHIEMIKRLRQTVAQKENLLAKAA